MTDKSLPVISANQIVYNFINWEMDMCEDNFLMRILFEKNYVKDGYQIDWNKRLDNKGEWKDKKELKE